MKVRLENWSVVQPPANPYMAPEMITSHLNGEAFGHPSFEDGTKITTSPLVEWDGKNGKTFSGTEYEVGEQEPEYKAWCEEHNV